MQITPAISYLAARCLNLSGSGKVYTYYPIEPTGALMKAAFGLDGRLNLCIITRPTADPEQFPGFMGYVHPVRLELRRTYIDGTTQADHDDLIDTLLTALASDTLLGGTSSDVITARLVRNEAQLFYQHLVHYAEIAVNVHTT